MNFSFGDEQREFQSAVRALFAKKCPTERVRDAWMNDDGRAGVWGSLAEMGVVGLLAPESSGGLGLTEIDLVLLLEESGRACLPEPIVETVAVAIPTLASLEDPRLDALVAGESTASVIPATDRVAVWADTASVILQLDEDGVDACDVGQAILTPAASVDGSRRLFSLRRDSATRIGDAAASADAFDRGVLGVAAQLLGLSWWMLDITVDYAKEREQFGAKIGTFQAVKHHLANARLAIEFAAPLVYRAAHSVAHHESARSTHVSMAKAQASDAASAVARAALQCHGAIGYTTEYDLHLYLKRTWALARSWGDATWHRRRVGRAILDPDTDPREV